MRMITFVNGTAFVVLGLTYTLPRYLLQRKKTSDLEVGTMAVIQFHLVSDHALLQLQHLAIAASKRVNVGVLLISVVYVLQDGSVAQTPLREIVTGALIMGVSVSVLAAGTIVGSSYTSAYLVCS